MHFNGDPCLNYKTLSDDWRKIGSGGGLNCDDDLINDETLRRYNNWFRFVEPAGVKLSNTDIGHRACGTSASGYMIGTHPTIDGQTVTRRVCFSWYGSCYGDRYENAYINVTLCSGRGGRFWYTPTKIESFYIYRLSNPLRCNAAYCAKSN